MAVRDDLIEALNSAIDRLNRGESIEQIVADYPALAGQLRPMLEAGLVLPRARYPLPEVTAAEAAGETLIRQTIAEVFTGGAGLSTTVILIVLAVLIGGGALLWGVLGGGIVPAVVETVTPTATVTASPTLTLTPTATLTPTLTPTASATATLSAALTATPQESVLVIQGPVSAVLGNVITIYDFEIVLEPDDPYLTVIKIGDVIRIEGDDDGGIIQVINLTFVNVGVVVQGNQAWRDDDCSVGPPPWANANANAWRSRCGPAPAGGGGGDHDDDDDD